MALLTIASVSVIFPKSAPGKTLSQFPEHEACPKVTIVGMPLATPGARTTAAKNATGRIPSKASMPTSPQPPRRKPECLKRLLEKEDLTAEVLLWDRTEPCATFIFTCKSVRNAGIFRKRKSIHCRKTSNDDFEVAIKRTLIEHLRKFLEIIWQFVIRRESFIRVPFGNLKARQERMQNAQKIIGHGLR